MASKRWMTLQRIDSWIGDVCWKRQCPRRYRCCAGSRRLRLDTLSNRGVATWRRGRRPRHGALCGRGRWPRGKRELVQVPRQLLPRRVRRRDALPGLHQRGVQIHEQNEALKAEHGAVAVDDLGRLPLLHEPAVSWPCSGGSMSGSSTRFQVQCSLP